MNDIQNDNENNEAVAQNIEEDQPNYDEEVSGSDLKPDDDQI